MNRDRARAFTLVEVMLALGVFAIAVLGMMAALQGIMTVATETRLEHMIRGRIENRLAVLESETLKEVSRKIEFDAPKGTFTETIRPERLLNGKNEALDGLWRVTVAVDWTAGGQARHEEVSILRYGP